jgi:hypothetical protein
MLTCTCTITKDGRIESVSCPHHARIAKKRRERDEADDEVREAQARYEAALTRRLAAGRALAKAEREPSSSKRR